MLTIDKDTSHKKSLRFYTIEKVSENREKTPEGYLVCYAAKLSRTGVMLYKKEEVPVTPDSEGFVRVLRYEEDVFKASAITSALGKSVVNNHPTDSDGNPVDVLPENWKNYEVGTILNPRRGEGEQKDCLVADLLIKDATAIQLIEDGKVQLSCGYDAEYKELSPGFAQQYDIIINHVALVDNGRCGPRCAIMDEDTFKLKDSNSSGDGKLTMTTFSDALTNLRKSFKTLDVAMDEKDNPALSAILEKLEGIEGRLNKLEVVKVADRKSRNDDDDDDDDDKKHRDDDDDDKKHRRDARKRRDDDDDDRRRQRDLRKRREDDDDDDDDDKKRRDDDDDDDDKKRRDDKYQYTMHYRGAHSGDKKKKRDDDDDDRKRRDDDDNDDKKRRDARKRRHDDDDDDAFMTDKRKRRDDDDYDDDDKKRRDKRVKSKDSAHLEDTWQETISFAEILIPGIQPPKFVRDADAFVTLDALCQFRKGVLQQFGTDEKNKSLIVELYGSVPSYQNMSCSAAKTLFRDAAIVMKRVNNHSNKTSDVSFGIQKVNNSIISSPTEMNKYYAKYWNGQFAQSEGK
jgi:hypothetical protein